MDLLIDTDFFDLLNIKTEEELEEYLSFAKIDIIKTHDGRILFYSNLFDTSVRKYKIRYQTKGLIIDSLDKSIICMSSEPHSYYENVNKAEVKKYFIDNYYSIMKVNDGTTITIYNFDGIFNICTGKSTDISNYYWNGEKTFAQMFYESALTNEQFIKDTELVITESGHIKWNIPKEYCITLGFRNGDIHPNICDNNRVWLIKSYNLKTKQDEEIDKLKSLEINVFKERTEWNKMIDKCSRDQNLDQRERFYGYILVSTNKNIPYYLKRVFIPSTLYKTLQYFFYSFIKNVEDKLNHKIRYIYSVFRNVILNNTDFLKLLCDINPKYNLEIEEYNNFINELTIKASLRFSDENSDKDTIYDEFITSIHKQIISDERDFNHESIIGHKLINDYIKNPKNISNISNLFFIKNKS